MLLQETSNNNIEDELVKELINGTNELINIKGDKQREDFYKFELVRIQGNYNVLDIRAKQLTGLTDDEYKTIIKKYSKLTKKYPEVRRRAFIGLETIKLANIIKQISIKGCNNCMNIISEKICIEDFCNMCKEILNQNIK